MFKKWISMTLLFAICVFALCGCNSAVDVLDDNVSSLESDYSNYEGDESDKSSVLDTLDMMLDQYVSGLQKPSPDEIQQNTVDPDEDTDLFQNVNDDLTTVDEMKAYILQGVTDTEDFIEFYIDSTVFTGDVLYDVVFNQICEEYMIETLGLQKYSYTMMNMTNGKVAVKLDFSYFDDKYTIDEVKDMKKETLLKAKEIVRNLDIANKSEFEAVSLVNKYLCDNCVYPEAEPYSKESHSPYGALIEQSAVCEGYARAVQLIFSLAGLDSYYVVGQTQGGGHAWNLVKVDGNYYQLDVTWNDVDSQSNMYFLVTDDYMSLSRTWERQKYPATPSSPYSN